MDDNDPETLMMNAFEPSDPEAATSLKLDLDRSNLGPESFVLIVPRCCQLRQGTTDAKGINDQVREGRYLYLQSGEADREPLTAIGLMIR